MNNVVHNKLVRDKIPDILRAKGVVTQTKILSEHEYEQFLKLKLLEEVHEYIAACDEEHQLEELADVVEVLRTLLSLQKKSFYDLERVRQDKQRARGGFQKRIFLEKTVAE